MAVREDRVLGRRVVFESYLPVISLDLVSNLSDWMISSWFRQFRGYTNTVHFEIFQLKGTEMTLCHDLQHSDRQGPR